MTRSVLSRFFTNPPGLSSWIWDNLLENYLSFCPQLPQKFAVVGWLAAHDGQVTCDWLRSSCRSRALRSCLSRFICMSKLQPCRPASMSRLVWQGSHSHVFSSCSRSPWQNWQRGWLTASFVAPQFLHLPKYATAIAGLLLWVLFVGPDRLGAYHNYYILSTVPMPNIHKPFWMV